MTFLGDAMLDFPLFLDTAVAVIVAPTAGRTNIILGQNAFEVFFSFFFFFFFGTVSCCFSDTTCVDRAYA